MKNVFALGRLFKNNQKNESIKADISVEQVQQLLEKIKEFNAGVIDVILTKHVDDVFAVWLKEIKGETDAN